MVADSEYHYGSDFEDDDDAMADSAESDKSSDEDDQVSGAESDDLKVESDVDLDDIDVPMRPLTPVPFWLRSDEPVPALLLPSSSDDLPIPSEHILSVFATYEICRQFHQVLRLTPFRIEDFCMALASEEQSNLLSEVHMALLRAIVRSEDVNSSFGALDQKDSINSVFFFMDSVTWPECMKAFFHSDPVTYGEPLELLNDSEYPFGVIEDVMGKRIQILRFLSDQILLTANARDFILEDGKFSNEEHCRVCHRLGEMLVCDTCPGVYHLGCLEPAMTEVPDEEWRCYVCEANDIEGLSECHGTKLLNACRQETLGYDRQGNRYWFLCRRLVVEMTDGTTKYYSTVKQLEEVSEVLDDEIYEKDLWDSMEAIRIDMERHMEITEFITQTKKSNSKKSYFEIENSAIEKIQHEREESKLKLASEETKKEMDIKLEPEESASGSEQLGKVPLGDMKSDEDGKDIEMKADSNASPEDDKTVISPIQNSVGAANPTIANRILKSGETVDTTKIASQVGKIPHVDGDLRLTRKTLHDINSGTLFFKLGQEGSFKQYVNHYATNPNALSKSQANEERIKRQHISHKFSLTDVSVFKWLGSLHGTRLMLITTLRQTILQLENNVPTIFMHPNWPLLRKPWIGAVTNSNKPRDFARALTVLQCCMKPCILLPVWSEMLGHTTMKKLPNLQKEEKKRLEKREKQEREAEEERLRPHMTFVKYTLGLKHQVSKQKGEEYRAHGQYGWLWLSSSRSFAPQDARTIGLRAGPFRLAVKYSDIRDGSFKIVLMEPKAFAYLVSKQEEMDQRKKEEEKEQDKSVNEIKDTSVETMNTSPTSEALVSNPVVKSSEKPSQEKKRLEDALKHARLETQDQPNALFEEVVDISAALTNPTRVLYPKVAKKAKVLDEFLNRRLQLKSLEERRIEMKLKQSENSTSRSLLPQAPTQEKALAGVDIQSKAKADDPDEIVDVEGESDTKTAITSMLAEQELKSKDETKSNKLNLFLDESKKTIWNIISNLRDEAKEIESSELQQNPSQCYSPICSKSKLRCYSANCPAKKIADLPIIKEAQTLVAKIISTGNELGLNVETSTDTECKSISEMMTTLQNVVKVLMTKKDELDKYKEMGISTVSATISSGSTPSSTTTSEIVNNDTGTVQVISTKSTVSVTQSKSITTTTETTLTSSNNTRNGNESGKSSVSKLSVEIKAGHTTSKAQSMTEVTDGITRVYSSQDTTTKLYLKRIQSVAESKKQSKVVKYPLAPHFYARTRKKRNILLLAKHDVKHMARLAGTALAEGFNYNCKTNNQVWPYPCPRPVFRTAWLYRTACMDSLQAVALQLRILWACLKWDDIQTRPVSTDGKHQQTTDSAVLTTEITKHRHVGRFSERTQYFQKKTTIPLDVPKTVVEVTPIRSGLRKRKRAESPQQSEPKTIEHWIDEEKLELWEIRAYRDKIERDKNASITRSRTGVPIKEPQRFEPIAETTVKKKPSESLAGLPGVGEGKALEDRLREKNKTIGQSPIMGQTQTIIRRVTNADGSVTLVRSITTASPRTIAPNGAASMVSASPGSRHPTGIQPGTKKVFISKDGKIIGAQVMPTTPVVTNKQVSLPNSGTTTSLQPSLASNPSASSPLSSMGPAQQKVQIVRAGDGKIQVKGLLPGQQLVQMPDGKLQIFSNPSSGASSATGGIQLANSPSSTPTQKPTLPQPLGASPLAAKVGIQSHQLSSTPTGKSNQIVATYLPPGAPIPSGMSAFISGGKTFCIPKASASLASQGVGAKTTAIISQQAPIMTATASPTVGASVKPVGASTPSPSTPKQIVEVKSLGSNTVTFKGNQMIVSGPDVAQAQLIAKQLSSGQAKLAMIGGKQVLISTNTNNTMQTPTVSTVSPTPTLPKAPSLSVTPSLSAVAPQPAPTQAQPIPAVQEELKSVNPSIPRVQVTAQLMQTPQGPRIVLQGIQGSNLPPEDLAIIQQQVKTQLLKAQADAKQQGKVPPTKIVLDLPANIQSKLQPTAASKPVTNTVMDNDQKARVPPALPQHPVNGIPQNVSLTSPVGSGVGVSQKQLGLGLPGLGTQVPSLTPKVKSVDGADQAISKTLASLSPVSLPTGPQIHSPSPPKICRPRSESEKESDEKKRQQILSKMATLVSRQKELLKKEIARKRALQEKDLQLEIQSEINRVKERICDKTITAGAKFDIETITKRSAMGTISRNNLNASAPAHSSNNHWDEEPPQHLGDHDITASVSSSGSSSLVPSTNLATKNASSLRPAPPSVSKNASGPTLPLQVISSTLKRKREDSLESENSSESTANHSTLESGDSFAPMKKRTRTSSISSAALAASMVKKDKIYCLCKTKYDPTKFYVGCDICSNWFHGSCVGITKSMSRNMSEFVCKDCKKAKEDQEIYCLCKQAYDESQFYIGCERCGDWFHGRCVGILQKESESIDEYLCPNCEPNSPINQANMHSISSQHYEHIGKLLRQVMSNRNSGPFREPVRPKSVPNYYKIVKEPMDLHTIETRVSDQHYERLCEFVGDFMRIFENCRYFNQPNSPIMRSAEALETFFAQKLVLLRERLLQVS
eukprot:TCALIF_10753-PA protein Name:"Similar to E(bx) Nucleosome-remodeling factor subunit NURF301 (Drosophila melanogaster)" AED:0.03 eAED:0.03 QI:0/0.85/0.75/0.87/1/1/8/257/2554